MYPLILLYFDTIFVHFEALDVKSVFPANLAKIHHIKQIIIRHKKSIPPKAYIQNVM